MARWPSGLTPPADVKPAKVVASSSTDIGDIFRAASTRAAKAACALRIRMHKM